MTISLASHSMVRSDRQDAYFAEQLMPCQEQLISAVNQYLALQRSVPVRHA